MTALYRTKSKWQTNIFRICLLIEIGLLSVLVILGRDPDVEDQQYTELAQAIVEGHVYLDIEVPEKVLNAEDPYQETWLEGYDRAYYEGHVYVYFGILPCLLFELLPAAMGKILPEFIAQLILCVALCIGIYLLYRKAAQLWFEEKAPFWGAVIGYFMLMNTSYILWNANTSRVYEISCLSGLVFTVFGLWCYLICCQRNLEKRDFILPLTVGSACMALTLDCRPNMILWCFMAIPLLWDAVIKRFWKDRGSWIKVCCAAAPYLLVGLASMYYNFVRFGSPFQFGQVYVITGFNIREAMTVKRILPGLKYYYLMPPAWKGEFPFLEERFPSETFITPNFRYFCGLAVNLYMWLLLLIPVLWKRLCRQEKKLLEICLWLAGISMVQSLVDIYCGGLFHRYYMDFAWGYSLAAALAAVYGLGQIRSRGLQKFALLAFGALVLGNTGFHFLLNCRNEGGFYYTLIRVQWFLDKVGNHAPFFRKINLIYYEAV